VDARRPGREVTATARLRRDVRYEDNGRVIEATDLVLPLPSEVVDPVRP